MSPLSFGRCCKNASCAPVQGGARIFSSSLPCARAHFLVFRTPPEGNRSFASAWLQVGRDGGIIIVLSCVIVAATSSHNLKTCRRVLRVSGTVASNVQHEGLSQRDGTFEPLQTYGFLPMLPSWCEGSRNACSRSAYRARVIRSGCTGHCILLLLGTCATTYCLQRGSLMSVMFWSGGCENLNLAPTRAA